MQYLILQPAGEHEKNKDFRECLCLKHSLELLGHKVIVCGRGHDTNLKESIKLCDVIIIIESQQDISTEIINTNKPKIFWSIDAHITFNKHLRFCSKARVGLVLSSTKSFVNKFKKRGFSCRWFPNAYPANLIKMQTKPKTVNVGFCGSLLKDRKDWCDKLNIHIDNWKLGNDMIDSIAKYKIHWNKNYSIDINYRTFETLGVGTFLLTNETDSLLELFETGKHLVTYKDFEDCRKKINYFLKHDNERQEIALNGYFHVVKNHTYNERAKLLDRIVNEVY